MTLDYLPREIISHNLYGSTRKFILLVGAFLFIFNGLFYAYLKIENPNLGYRVNAEKWLLLEKLSDKKDWLILGDSTCNQGVSPAVLERELGSSTVNLCTIGDMLTINDAWLLERYIKKFGPPKNVLIIHAYDVWHREKMDTGLTSQLPLLSLMREKPVPWIFNRKDELTLLFYKYVPLYSQKSSLLKIITGFFQKKDSQNPASFDENGFMSVEQADLEMVSISKKNHKEFLKNNRFFLSQNNLAGLESIKRMSEKYEFNIFLANSPINTDILQDENFSPYFSAIKECFNNYTRENSRIYYLSDAYGFPDEEMTSSDHITVQASQVYSKEIAKAIKKINALSVK